MEAEIADEGYDHPVFRVNPQELQALVGQYVEVATQADVSAGFLYTADPVSESIVISMPVADSFQFRLFPGGSVKNLVQKEPPPGVEFQQELDRSLRLSKEEAEVKRSKIVQWLRKNLLPVSVKGEVIDVYEGSLLIYPPYESSDCVTDNSIVLGRMQHLLRNVPDL